MNFLINSYGLTAIGDIKGFVINMQTLHLKTGTK